MLQGAIDVGPVSAAAALLDRINGAFIAGKQYVDELTWTRGLDPKTGRPLDYDPNKNATYVAGTTATRTMPVGKRCPAVSGGKNWEPGLQSPARPDLHSDSGGLQPNRGRGP